nr:hypothetical protein [Tanacetum cinerariifolium]
ELVVEVVRDCREVVVEVTGNRRKKINSVCLNWVRGEGLSLDFSMLPVCS